LRTKTVRTHRQTHRQTDRHTPMITIPCGLRRAGNKQHNGNSIHLMASFQDSMDKLVTEGETIPVFDAARENGGGKRLHFTLFKFYISKNELLQ